MGEVGRASALIKCGVSLGPNEPENLSSRRSRVKLFFMACTDSTQRFSSRVGNYVRYRPEYPACGSRSAEEGMWTHRERPSSPISPPGPAFSPGMLLENGNRVFGVEPNAEMRHAGEECCGTILVSTAWRGRRKPRRSRITASISSLRHRPPTGLIAKRRAREFIRIGRPGGWTVLLWNERRTGSTPFLRAYEQLLVSTARIIRRCAPSARREQIETFFAPSRFQVRTFDNRQEFDYPALEGRLLSSSYTPQAATPATRPCCANCGESSMSIRSTSRGVRVRHAGVLRAVGLSLAS